MVAEVAEEVVGYMIYELHKRKLRILRFVVHPKIQRQGIGTQMIHKLKAKLSTYRRTRLEIIVPENVTEMHFFLKKNFFRAKNVIKGEFFNGDVDGYRFLYEIEPEFRDEEE